MAKRNELIMASVFEDTRTHRTDADTSTKQGKFMAVDYPQLDLAMSYLCSIFVLF